MQFLVTIFPEQLRPDQWLPSTICVALLIFSVCSFWFTSSLLKTFLSFPTFIQQIFIKHVLFALWVGKSTSLPMRSLYSNFVPLLSYPSSKYGYFVSSVYNCYFYLMASVNTSVKSSTKNVYIFPWCHLFCISTCLLDIINSSFTKEIECISRLKSSSLIFLLCVPILWNCIILLKITPTSEPSSPISS